MMTVVTNFTVLPPASADFLLGLFFDPEVGDYIFLETSVSLLTTRRYNPQDRILTSDVLIG
jgi:hypothetical protein